MAPVPCIVPAAGRSERMGTWKPVLAFQDSTIIQTVVRTALSACGRLILVTGYRGDELAALFAGEPRVRLVANPDWELGMFSSIRIAVREVDCERFFVVLGDMPYITPEVYTALREAPRADAVFPVFDGMRGHPVLLSRAVGEAVMATDPRTGSMRDILARFPVGELPWPDDSVLRDIDTPQEYGGLP